jgi:Fur family ferric uptake transcriptional regulator
MAESRTTNQRIKILEHLRSVKTHPTAELVYEEVRKDLPAISLATVYRNLNLLAEQKQILKFEINGEFHYDGDICSHQHCVCGCCGKIIDVFQKSISDYALKNVNVRGFRPSCVCIIFNGTCNSCR